MIDWFVVMLAPFVGMITGLMPAMGVTMAVILTWPLLNLASAESILCFYLAVLVTSQFAGSVAAINLGLLGEHTSLPVLKERTNILRFGAQQLCLHHTAISSAVATAAAVSLLAVLILMGQSMVWLFRTEVLWIVVSLTLVLSTRWPGNGAAANSAMIFSGVIVGMIGYRAETGQSFLVFDNAYLAGGIPIWPVILGLYAVPCLIKISRIDSLPTVAPTHIKNIQSKIDILASLRGTAIGFIVGMIPAMGHMISSSTAHIVERLFRSTDSMSGCLSRLTSAEAANNAAYVSSLVPMLVLGLAIQPSETLILDLLTMKSWTTKTMLDLSMIGLLLATMIYAVIVAWSMSTHVSAWLCQKFVAYHQGLVITIIAIIIMNISWLGSQADQPWYYLIVFTISAALGIALRKFDTMPVILSLMLQDYLFESSQRMISLYF